MAYWNLLIWLQIACGWVLVFLPYTDRLSHDNVFDNLHDTDLQERLSHYWIEEMILAAVMVNLPMLVDVVLDIQFMYNNRWNLKVFFHWVARAVIILSLFIPNLALYLNRGSYFQALVFICTTGFRHLTIMGCILFYLRTNVGDVWGSKFVHLCLSLCVMSQVFNVYAITSSSYQVMEALRIASVVLVVCSSFLLLWLIGKWISLITTRDSLFNYLRKHQEAYCGLIYIVLLLIITVSELLYAINNISENREQSDDVLSWYMYIQIGSSILITTLPGRSARLEAVAMSYELESKRVFVRYISHELRTPMNTILLGLQYLHRSLEHQKNDVSDLNQNCVQSSDHATKSCNQLSPFLSGGDRDLLESTDANLETVGEVKESCLVALDILNDLLAFDKLESGMLVLDRNNEDVVSFFADALRPFHIQAREANIEMSISMGRDEIERDVLESFFINIDKFKMSQVVRNMVSNALKFSPNGSKVWINVNIEEPPDSLVSSHIKTLKPNKVSSTEQTPTAWIRFSIRDSGPGIDRDNHEKLFNQIVQFNPQELQGGGGSGLGLFISHGIVKLHDGHIGFTSDGLGTGCTFYFYLRAARYEVGRNQLLSKDILESPHNQSKRLRSKSESMNSSHLRNNVNTEMETRLADTTRETDFLASIAPAESAAVLDAALTSRLAEKEDLRQENVAAVSAPTRSVPVPLRVLIVDDSALNRKMLMRLLKDGPFECFEASDGDIAVAMIAETIPSNPSYQVNININVGRPLVHLSAPIDLILMDYIMVNMHGPDAAAAIRNLGFEGVILGVTGNVLQADIANFVNNGANRVLPKPLSMDALFAALEAEMRVSLCVKSH